MANEETTRVKLGPNGEVRLPVSMQQALGVEPGRELRLTLKGQQVLVERYVPRDPFAEVQARPDPDAFDRIINEQAHRAAQARNDWERILKEGVEVRPEDHPDFWR